MMEHWTHLDPIQEESEREDATEGSNTGDDEEEDFLFQVGADTDGVLADDENEESEDDDDDAVLRVLRPRRLSRSSSQESFVRMQSTNNHQREMENVSLSDLSTHAGHRNDEATPPGQPGLGNENRSTSEELRLKISKIRWRAQTPPKQHVLTEKTRRQHKKKLNVEEPFPPWLVDLMVNIEEATTHQLVVERRSSLQAS